jgi:hypothetical protein
VKRHGFTRSIAVAVALLLASVAIAEEPIVSRSQLLSEEAADVARGGRERGKFQVLPEKAKGIAGLPFDLDGVTGGAELSVAVSNGKLDVVRETIVLPNDVAGKATISFLANHEKELGQIRKLAAAKPGTLRFTVSIGERVIADVPFAAADRGSANLAEGGAIVGQSTTVDVNIRDPRKIAPTGMQPDPECEAACNDTYVECYYVICDQRGDCSYCWEDYEYCAASCPQICVEPKSVSTYNTSWQYIGSYNLGNICLQNWYAYIFWEDVERRYVYQRTEHCDGTYTDVLQDTQYRSSFCKQYIGNGCFGHMTNPPPNY